MGARVSLWTGRRAPVEARVGVGGRAGSVVEAIADGLSRPLHDGDDGVSAVLYNKSPERGKREERGAAGGLNLS